MIPEDHLDFLQAVWTRRPRFTYIFLAINIVIFLLMSLAGGTTSEETLMAFGVKSNAQIDQGQLWRFVTPIFIHIGLLHLLFNSYALWMVGPQVEKLYGSERFVILYVVTGVAGVFGSYFYHPQSISAGASGAIFGLFGVLLVFGIRYRHSIPPFFKRAVGTSVPGCPPYSAGPKFPRGCTVRLGVPLSLRCLERKTTSSGRVPNLISTSRST